MQNMDSEDKMQSGASNSENTSASSTEQQTKPDENKNKKGRKTRQVSALGYNFLKFGFFFFFIMTVLLIYSNYNYMIFKFLIADNYIYTDTLDQLYIEIIGEENFRGYRRNFDHVVIGVFTERIRSINEDRYTRLYTPERYRLVREIERADGAAARMEELTPDTVYVILPNISTGTRSFMLSNADAINEYDNLVLDLRANYGGLLMDFHRIAELFTQSGDVLGHEMYRMPLISRTITSGGSGHLEFDKIIILQDENTASAAEGLISALKANLDNVTTIGSRSFGKGIGQVTLPLLDGFAVKATIMQITGPDNTSINRIGIEPDILHEDDDIIDAALEIIRQ